LATHQRQKGDLPDRPHTGPTSERPSPEAKADLLDDADGKTFQGPRVTLIVLYVNDIQACRFFYENLGLDFVVERHEEGPEHLAAVLADGGVLEIYPSGRRGPTGRLRVGLTVPHGLLKDRRLTVGTHLLRDPDNRTVEVTVV